MTAPALRTFAFGDLDAGVWGTAWLPSSAGQGFVILEAGAGALVPTVSVDGEDDEGQWLLRGDGVELGLSPASEPVASTASEAALQGYGQLCRVAGHLAVEGSEHRIECLGYRAIRTDAGELARFESIREVSAWFAPGEGFAVLALRRRMERGHGADLLTAALLNAQGPGTVVDGRLSTTYTAAGTPTRAGLELWIAKEEQEEYSRRAAGEAVSRSVVVGSSAREVQASLFRWHLGGVDGAGVYLLSKSG